MNCIFKNKVYNTIIPPQIEQLYNKQKFKDFSKDEIFLFYRKFRIITKGKDLLSKSQFKKLLAILTSQQIYDKMYSTIDEDNSGFIGFQEFMNYMLIIQRGSKSQKTEFIFKLICLNNQDFFTFEDLKVFYTMINSQYQSEQKNDHDESDDSFYQDEEQEMSAIVFELMKINIDEKVTLKLFQNFLHSNNDFQNLFNFLSIDAEKNRNKIKEKQNLNYLENLVDDIYNDVQYLENAFDQNNLSLNDLNNQSLRRKNKFAALFQKVVHVHMNNKKNSNSDQIRTQTINDFINKDIRKKSTLPQDGNNIGKRNLQNIFQQIKKKIQKITNWIGKELQQFEKKDKFEQQIRKSINKKKQNQEIIFLTNPNWNIAVSIVKGISKSINIIQNDHHHSIGLMDFKINNKIEMESIFSTAFNKFKFKDYSPHVFQSLRREAGVNNESYIQSIGYKTFQDAFFDKLNFMLSENSSGKSGSFFFHTADQKYMIKTIKKSEFKVLLKQLPDYYKHILENPNSLLPRYFGLHGIQCYQNKSKKFDIYIIVMNNVFKEVTQNKNLITYDLKGSMYKRLTSNQKIMDGEARKDQNFIMENQKLQINDEERENIIFQLLKDSHFLSKNQIIDYSFLLGIDKSNTIQAKSKQKIRFNIKNQVNSQDFTETYYFGIIDTLTRFGMRKKAEGQVVYLLSHTKIDL